MRLQLPLESDPQLAEPCKPAVRAFDNPAVLAKPLAALDALSGNATGDSTSLQIVTATLVVVALVCMQLTWSAPWSTAQPFDSGQCIQTPLEQHGVMPVGTAHQHYQRNAAGIYDDVPLGAELAPVRGVGTRFLAPRGLGTDEPSMLARLQSIWSYSRKCSSVARCRRCQTPAACHSRKRLQHVMPLP